MMASEGLLWGPDSLTEAQVIALSLVAVVLLLLLALNVGVYKMYRRVMTEDRPRTKRPHEKKMSDVWVYQVHRENPQPAEPAEEQILRKLRASNENLKAAMRLSERGAEEAGDESSAIRQEEQQALEELDITNDLFFHDGSRRSSSTTISFESNINAIITNDTISLSSVFMSDFDNDEVDDAMAVEGGTRPRKMSRQPPLTEFHNDAFDFAEATAEVERINDIQL